MGAEVNHQPGKHSEPKRTKTDDSKHDVKPDKALNEKDSRHDAKRSSDPDRKPPIGEPAKPPLSLKEEAISRPRDHRKDEKKSRSRNADKERSARDNIRKEKQAESRTSARPPSALAKPSTLANPSTPSKPSKSVQNPLPKTSKDPPTSAASHSDLPVPKTVPVEKGTTSASL